MPSSVGATCKHAAPDGAPKLLRQQCYKHEVPTGLLKHPCDGSDTRFMATAEKSLNEAVRLEGRGRLLRVLGVVFGMAVTVGITVGMGILRTPGEVAAQLPNPWLFLGAWLLGGVYALCGALSVAELGTMIPRSGGFYVFARRALGEYLGFVVGWSDWLSTCGTVSAVSLVVGEYAGALVPALGGRDGREVGGAV